MNGNETIALQSTSKERIQRIHALVAAMISEDNEPVEGITGDYLELKVRSMINQARFAERNGINWELMQ